MKWLLCLMFVVGACSGAGIYDSLVITEVNDVTLLTPQSGYESCTLSVQFNAIAKKGAANEVKIVSGIMTNANITLTLGDYLKLGKLIYNNKASRDALEMYSILCEGK